MGAQGVSAIDPKTTAKLTTEGEWELQQYSFDDKTAQFRLIGDDVAIAAYKVTERMHTESLAGDPYGHERQTVR